MLDFLVRRLGRTGRPPGTLEYIGDRRDFAPQLHHYAFDANGLSEACIDLGPDTPILPADKTNFLNLVGVHDPAAVKRVGDWFGLPPLLQEDILSPGQRPKANEAPDGVFLSLRNVAYDAENRRLVEEQVCLVYAEGTVLAFQETAEDAWAPVIERLRRGRGRIRAAGAAYLLIALLDALVDRAMDALGSLSMEVEAHEAELTRSQDEKELLELYRAKRDVTFLLRNSLMPTTEILAELRDEEFFTMPADVRPYLDDVAEHALHAVESAKVLHDMLGSMMDVHISIAGMRMNNVMKVLTIVATIFIPLTFIAGIYGMNFDHMPELHWRWGYPASLVLMGALALVMLWYFARKRWF